jgi:hypothetical protein
MNERINRKDLTYNFLSKLVYMKKKKRYIIKRKPRIYHLMEGINFEPTLEKLMRFMEKKFKHRINFEDLNEVSWFKTIEVARLQ